jgi:hypothetical protein
MGIVTSYTSNDNNSEGLYAFYTYIHMIDFYSD